MFFRIKDTKKITPKDQCLSLFVATFTINWVELSKLVHDSFPVGFSLQTGSSDTFWSYLPSKSPFCYCATPTSSPPLANDLFSRSKMVVMPTSCSCTSEACARGCRSDLPKVKQAPESGAGRSRLASGREFGREILTLAEVVTKSLLGFLPTHSPHLHELKLLLLI